MLRKLTPWAGIGLAILAAGLYFCGYQETGVFTFACAVALTGAAIVGILALVVLSWIVKGLWHDVVRMGLLRTAR
jgi:hypothetical protein